MFKAENVDAVIHCAALKAVGESVQKPLEYYHNNITGTLSLMGVMDEVGAVSYTHLDVYKRQDVNRVNGSWGSYLMDLEELAADYEKEHANETLFKIARTAGGGTLKSIPYQPSIFGFFYNKTLFAKAGIEAAPTTWAEFDAACKKLVDAGITPITGDTVSYTHLRF